MTRPLRSARITGHRRYYEAVRPCAPRRYSAPRSCRCLGSSLLRPGDRGGPVNGRRCRGDRFTRSAPEPELSSRRLYAGHRLGSRQVAPRLVPGERLPPGFDVVDTLSTRHQRFALARLLSSYLTRSRRAVSATLTTPALDRRSLRWFETSPCRAIPEGRPPSLAQHRSSSSIFYIDPSLRSCHTVSGRGESHPPALAEPDVNLSAHPAPIIQPHGTSPRRQWAKRPRSRLATVCSHLLARLACRCSRLNFCMAQRTR